MSTHEPGHAPRRPIEPRCWGDFEREAGDLAGAARRLFVGEDGVAIGFLATASRSGAPHLAPVCPIFAGDGLYLSGVSSTPKVRDLRENGRFALHAFLGENDEELQLRGVASEVTSPGEREQVHAAIRFGSFEPSHPIFALRVAGATWIWWENAGQPGTRAVRRVWPEAASAPERTGEP